ncbi:Neuronal acetylcholine receptor subunit alpha-2 [Habropoda laboriosa]|uniref:Neuronal acetylcholine receptor subunit alpha-2 n=1 Tax=Habropoda laboriosa TaxID=597456 RepID=A0A0L7QK66_9HYME|nr:PREDICTED: neuronal acetylcholine receptor subunit alpha-2-like [Habropoda laboriosa]KOC58999.1 Neuronal acetylcholine receptor subunit alpha-2 [Habropoda laboriosa]
MCNLFHVFFVIFSILWLNQGGLCVQGYCKDIVNNSVILRLKEHLFCSYDTDVRPTDQDRNATVVRFGLYMRQFDVDDLTNVVDFHVWVRLVWNDPFLTWEPSEYDGVNSIHVMSYEIWMPDITIHSATTMGADGVPAIECWLNHTGNIFCVPAMSYTTSCESDSTWWPYDMINCTIHIGSWAYHAHEIDLRFIKFDEEGQLTVDIQDKNTQWEMVEFTQSERLVNSKFGLYFSTKYLSYHILLKRHSSMHGAIYVTIVVVLMTMTLMTLWLEPRSTERMIIANLNFVLHLWSVQDLQWMLPYTGNRPPALLLFYENSLALATFTLILTSVLRHMQELTAQAPVWISSITVSILKSRVGQVFLVSILDPKASARIEMNVDDNTNLVSFDKQETTWRYTSVLIGWLAFVSVFFVYVIMLIVVLPTDRSANIFSAKT